MAGIDGYATGGRDGLHSCVARNCVEGFDLNATTVPVLCEAYDNSDCGFRDMYTAHYCYSVGNGAEGFDQIRGGSHCIAHDNTLDGFVAGAANSNGLVHCIADGNGGDGFDMSGGGIAINCVATNNTGYGFKGDDYGALVRNCYYKSNTAGNIDTTQMAEEGNTLLTQDPYENLAADDFRPNATAGGGAELRGGSFTPVLPDTVNYLDAGALQHEDAGGGGGMFRRVPVTIGAGR